MSLNPPTVLLPYNHNLKSVDISFHTVDTKWGLHFPPTYFICAPRLQFYSEIHIQTPKKRKGKGGFDSPKPYETYCNL